MTKEYSAWDSIHVVEVVEDAAAKTAKVSRPAHRLSHPFVAGRASRLYAEWFCSRHLVFFYLRMGFGAVSRGTRFFFESSARSTSASWLVVCLVVGAVQVNHDGDALSHEQVGRLGLRNTLWQLDQEGRSCP